MESGFRLMDGSKDTLYHLILTEEEFTDFEKYLEMNVFLGTFKYLKTRFQKIIKELKRYD